MQQRANTVFSQRDRRMSILFSVIALSRSGRSGLTRDRRTSFYGTSIKDAARSDRLILPTDITITMSDPFQWLGSIAGAMTTFAFVPQVLRVWRRKSAADISASMYLIFATGLMLWIAYGWQIGSVPLIAANLVTLILAGSVVVMKMMFGERGL